MILKIRNNIAIIFLLIILYSCNKNERNIKFFSSGNVKYFYKDSLSTFYYDSINKVNYKKIFHFKDYDSIVLYYKNGIVFKNGKQDKERKKFGNWNKYTIDGHLSETTEYFIIKGEVIPNRFWYFDRKGDTLWYASRFNKYKQKEFVADTSESRNSSMISFKFYSKDTISIDEPFLGSVICNSPLGREYNSQIIMILGDEEFNFNKDFSNENEVKVDTFFNLIKDKKNRVNFNINSDKQGWRYIVAFGKWFKKPGKKKIRGYMLEYFDLPNDGNKVRKAERKVYFEKQIFVKKD